MGVLNAPPKYLAPGAQPHTVSLQLVSSLDDPSCKNTLDGFSKGAMKVKVPKSWKVYVTFANHGRGCTDGVAVVDAPGDTAPGFSGASTDAQGVPGGGLEYFEFTASDEGKYVIASTVPERAKCGRVDQLRGHARERTRS